MVISALPVRATSISYPYVFVDGQILPSAQLNGDYNAVSSVVNGNIDNTNIASGANIALNKLALTSQALNLQSTGNPAWASGITGDTVARIQLTSDGYLQFGPGSSTAVDTSLRRVSAGLIGVYNEPAGTLAGYEAASITLRNGNNLVFTPASIATTNRAITISDPGAAANQDFRTGSLTNHGVIITDGTNYKSTAAAGTVRQFLSATSSTDPTWAPAASFGGDGSDGAISISSGTYETSPYEKNATTLSVTSTWLVKSGMVINATGAVTLTAGAIGTWDGSNHIVSGNTGVLSGPNGSAGTAGASGASGGGGGGGYAAGGAGGAGGGGGGVGGVAGLGLGYALASIKNGGQGGAGASSGHGEGGANLRLLAIGAITLDGTSSISVGADSSVTPAAGFGGDGGGGGGFLIVASQTSITNAGTISANGGSGYAVGTTLGANSAGGGGGGGGWAIEWSPSITNTGTFTASGGAGGAGVGTGGSGTAGTAGLAQQITGTPNLPLLGWLEDHPKEIASLGERTTTAELARLAAPNNVALYLQYRSGSLTETCEAIGDAEVLKNAA